MPAVSALADFRTAVQNAKGAKIFILRGRRRAAFRLPARGRAREVSVFIGPEGGFDAEEVEFARAHGAVTATLGPRILRTETALLAALAILMFMTGNMA